MAIDAAIAAASAEPPEERVNVQVTLPTRRVVMMNIPRDMDVVEMLALAGYIGSKLPGSLAANRGPRSRLLLPKA